MKRNVVAGALCALISIAGCTEDVGDCYDGGTRGLDTVLNGGHVEYGGQAILNKACAQGCHSSEAKGAARSGAPAGLDFDLGPIDATGAEGVENANGRTYAKLDPALVNGLRERQRKVFSERNRIWQQIRDGQMPPDGRFSIYKTFTEMLFDSAESSPCTRGEPLKDIDSKQVQDVVRTWLACQAPIVEAYGGPVEVNGTAGSAGYQYLECSGVQPMPDGGAGDGGGMPSVPSFDDLYDGVFTDATCVGCHPLVEDVVDLSTKDKAYAAFVEDNEPKCGDKPYVTPGMPDQSFLVDLVALDTPCPSDTSIPRMPVGPALSSSQINQIRAWIAAGATRTAARIQAAPMSGGLDAGVP